MQDNFSPKQIFVIIAGVVYLIAFFALPYLSFLGFGASLFEVTEFSKALNAATKSADAGSVIATLLAWSIPLLALAAIGLAIGHRSAAGAECLEVASGVSVFMFIAAVYTTKLSFGNNMKLVIGVWWLTAGSGAYFFLFGGSIVGFVHKLLPGEDDATAGSSTMAPGTAILAPPPARTCPSCALANDLSARFCKSCGTALVTVCPKCKADLDDDSRFCRNCGSAAPAQLPPTPPPPPSDPNVIVVGRRRYVRDFDAQGDGICAAPFCKLYEAKARMYRLEGRDQYFHKNCIPD